MEEDFGISVNATKDQIEEFKESLLWKDICNELDFWSEGFAREHDSIVDEASTKNPSTAAVLMHLGDINGRKKAVAYFKQILDIFLNALEDRKDDTKR
jgi:hypothetical protein